MSDATQRSGTDRLASGARGSQAPTIAEGPEGATGTGGETKVEEAALGRGEPVGRYIVLDRIGVGGMGVIYQAYDPQLSRQVAIKVVKVARSPSLQKDPAGARLMREAQAMAQLAHPNVLSVYDVGDLDGDVFIAMEYVEGETLQQWLDASPHPWREILDRFAQAARGLAAAHAAGIVHRDFKPENVLIGRDGRARVLDFGLALAAEEEPEPPGPDSDAQEELSSVSDSLDGLRGRLTQYGMVMGTPDFMAPEQHMGNPPDHRCDQFSFCAALYCAVYRQKAFAGKTAKELARAKLKGRIVDPPRDSRVPRWLKRLIYRGLSAPADQRWGSMQELLAAIEQHTRRKNLRWFAAGGALLAATAAVSFTATRDQAPQICGGGEDQLQPVWNEERSTALQRAFVASGSPLAEDAWVRVTGEIEARLGAWGQMHEEACVATHVRREQSTQMLDLRMTCLSTRLDELDALLTVLEGADAAVVERSATAVRELRPLRPCSDPAWLRAQVKPPESEATASQVEALRREHAQSRALELAGRHAEALEAARQGVDAARRLDYPPLLAEAWARVGSAQRGLGDYAAAERALDEAFVQATATKHDRVAARAAIQLLEVVGVNQARTADGELWRRLARANVERLDDDPELEADLENTVGNFLERKGDFEAARSHYSRALALRSEQFGENDVRVAGVLTNLGALDLQRSDYEAARENFRRALDIRQQQLGETHPSVGRSLANLATAFYYERGYQAAIDHWSRGLEIIEASLGPEHPDAGALHTNLGEVMAHLGRFDEAEAHYARALDIRESSLGERHPDLAPTLSNLGRLHLQRGEFERALSLQASAIELTEEALGKKHPRLADYLAEYGRVLTRQAKGREARPILERALFLAEESYGPTHRQVATVLVYLAANELALGDHRGAVAHAERSLAIVGAREDDEAARIHFVLAQALWVMGDDRERALELADKAQELLAEGGVTARVEHEQVTKWLAEHDLF